MSIPKTIHYCWFGKNPMPLNVLKCIESWSTFCPNYTLKLWNEENFDVNQNEYVRGAYQCGKWAFVSDYARLKIIYEFGGIYLDTDVELIRSLDPLCCYDAYMGFQNDGLVATGLGFGASAGHPVIGEMMEEYETLSFIKEDGTMDLTPCPNRNTECLKRIGLVPNGQMQNICGVQILPAEYLSPMNYRTGKTHIGSHTYSIHHYYASWLEEEALKELRLERKLGRRLYNILYRVRGKWL